MAEILKHKFGRKVEEVAIVEFPLEANGLLEKKHDELLKSFEGCEVNRNKELNKTFLICFK